MPTSRKAPELTWQEHPGGDLQIGADAAQGFCFDNETPRHAVRLRPHAFASRLLTNAEFQAFIDDGGYRDPALWLSDGWTQVQSEGWTARLYWSQDRQKVFTLRGWRDLDPHAPVSHVSFYEADAYARWAGARLPTEAEWEAAADTQAVQGNLLEAGWLTPAAATAPGLTKLFGDVWEWTSSPYMAYPGFRQLAGSLGEYNGKFMCNQMSVRGGACLTSGDHLRASYRSFFYPHQRWQVLGFRLARDLD